MEDLLLKRLKKHAISKLEAMSLLILIAVIFLVSTLLTYYDVIHIAKTPEKDGLNLLIFSLIFLVLAIGIAVGTMIPYFLDYKSIKNKSYVTLTAVVSRFDFKWSGYEPMERIWFPVFVDINSGKSFTLEVDEKVEAGKQYSIVYLPRTKIPVLKSKQP